MNRYAVSAFALLCCTALFAGGIVAGNEHYTIDIAGSVDTPDRQVTLEGQEYTVSAIGVVAPGEAISVSVDAPADASYDLYLYNDDKRIADRINDASASETFDGDYSVGSYMVAVYADGDFQKVHPVIVKSYTVGLNTPDTAEQGDTVEFSVDVENVPNTPEDLDSVQIVISKDGQDQTLTTTETSDGTYVAETTVSETGVYLVYANVRGEETQDGRKELLGASESSTIDVREPTPTATPSPAPNPTETPKNGGGGTGGDTAAATPAPTSSQSATPTASPTTNSPDTQTSVPATPTATETATATSTPTQTQTPTPNNVVTPNPSTPTETSSGLPTLLAVVAVAGFGLLIWRQH